MLTLNVAGRSYTGLQALSYAQTAPIPFLWAERLAVHLNAVDQAVLRVLPFCCGLPDTHRIVGGRQPAPEALSGSRRPGYSRQPAWRWSRQRTCLPFGQGSPLHYSLQPVSSRGWASCLSLNQTLGSRFGVLDPTYEPRSDAQESSP
jgi:hypothetical protein